MTATAMNYSLATRASLLGRLKDWQDVQSWNEFFDRYWPVLYRAGLKSGLTEVEALDAAQETMLAVAKHIGKFEYNAQRCSFKSWLFLIARQRIVWQLRKRLPVQVHNAASEDETRGTSDRNDISDPSTVSAEQLWDKEWKENAIACALRKVKEKASARQFQIFDLHVAPGSRKDHGFFCIAPTTSHAIVLCESAIDALSCHALHPDYRCLSTSGARPDPAWLPALIAQGLPIYCGFDSDPTGDAMAQRMRDLHPSVRRLRPAAKDWNDLLRQLAR